MLRLEEALTSFEEGMPPPLQPSVEDFACILHKCRKERNLPQALRLHSYMCQSGLESHASLGNYLVSMLVEVGCMSHAQQVFDRLFYRKECSWNSLITGYVKCGEPLNALTLHQKMQEDGCLHPSGYAFVALLKACTTLKDLERGYELHTEIAREGLLERDVFVGSTLVHMYAKCGLLAKAQEVFDNLPFRDVVSWNALVAGYAEHGCGEEALYCFEQMKQEGISSNAVTLVCSLTASGSIGAMAKGQEIHAEIARKGLERELLIGNTLVDLYVKCGSLATAQEVFDKLLVRDVVSWTALIAGYAEHGRGEEALYCLEQMQQEGISVNAITFVCSLKVCGRTGGTEKGQEMHSDIVKKGLERELLIGNTLVDMYAKCGALATAQELFDKLPVRDSVSWTALITGYVEHGHGEEALKCAECMQHKGISWNAFTLVCSLKACGIVGARDKGRELHAEIVRKGLEIEVLVGNSLVDMYAKCGSVATAQEVFDKLPVRSVVSWTALMAGYVEHGCGEKALYCFEQMQQESIALNAVTFVCILKACGSLEATAKGQEMHAEIARRGLERELLVGSTLVDMYAKCGLLAEAQKVFDKLPARTVVSWNALIGGYAEHGHHVEALNCFKLMQDQGISPDALTLACSLKSCGSIGVKEIHSDIARKGLDREVIVGNILVDVYAKCGSLAEAQEMFDKLPVRDVVSWNALISGYAEHGRCEEALYCFKQMQHEGLSLNSVTLVCSLKACGSIGATAKGREIHAEIARRGLERELLVGNILVDMYAKCGLLVEAHVVFDKLPVRDVVSWNALVAGYAQLGECEHVFDMFDRMIGEGLKPDLVTFISVLNACSHAGLLDKGQMYFEAITDDCGFMPTLEHYTCMVDLLGRAGHIDKAVATIKKMPFHPGAVMWHTVLAACRKWGNVELGRHAFEHAVSLDEKDPAAYVYMSNIYADAAMQEEANKIEVMRVGKQAWKKPGHSGCGGMSAVWCLPFWLGVKDISKAEISMQS